MSGMTFEDIINVLYFQVLNAQLVICEVSVCYIYEPKVDSVSF